MAAKFDRDLLDAEVAQSTTDFLAWQREPDKLVALAKAFFGERLQARAIIDRLERTCAELEHRLTAAESKGLVDLYTGAWQSPMSYTRGQLTTSDGSLWIALVASTGLKPGTSAAWKCVVRAGRDLREDK